MKLTWIALVAAMLQLSACAELSEREKLLNHCRKVDQDASKAMLDSDSSQFEMTAASGSRRTCVEPLLYLAADFRLRSQPEESQQILQVMFVWPFGPEASHKKVSAELELITSKTVPPQFHRDSVLFNFAAVS